MRYQGQSFEIEVPLQLDWIAAGDWRRIAAAFHRAARPPLRPQLRRGADVTWSACAWWWWAPRRSRSFRPQPRRSGSPAPAKQIEVYLDGAWRPCRFYRRADLGHGHRFASPCVVAQEDTTICVPAGFTGAVDAYGNILLSLITGGMKEHAMRIDPVTLQIFANHAQAAAESMAFTLFRTAHSTFVKETEDFTTGLATPDGMTFASPRDLGATWFIGLDYAMPSRMVGDYRPGDICITNDPYSGFVVHPHARPAHVEADLLGGRAGRLRRSATSTTPTWAARCRHRCRGS